MPPEAGGFDSPEPQSWIQHTLFSNTSRSNTEVSQCRQRPSGTQPRSRGAFLWLCMCGGKSALGKELSGTGDQKGTPQWELFFFYVKGLLGLVLIKKQQNE